MKPTRIKPEVNIDAPATSIDEYFIASLVRKMTPPAKPKAESIASTSPNPLTIDDNDDDFVAAGAVAVVLVSVLSGTVKGIWLVTGMKRPPSANAVAIR